MAIGEDTHQSEKARPTIIRWIFLKENLWEMPEIEGGGDILHGMCSIFGEIYGWIETILRLGA